MDYSHESFVDRRGSDLEGERFMNLKQVMGIMTGTVSKMQFPENREIVRRTGADSMVLLKNDAILPMKKRKVALFGAGAVDTIFCGNYSNYVATDKHVSAYEGLKNAGFTFTTEIWLQKMTKAVKKANQSDNTLTRVDRLFAGRTIHPAEIPISVADMAESILGTDTCIYVLRRETNESKDRAYEKNDYLLSEDEMINLKLVASSFKNIILVLNCGLLELSSISKLKNIKAIIYMGVAGMEAGNSLADIITGKVNPSGHLTDTWAKKYKDYPTCQGVRRKKTNNINIDYKEGIFVGYRYFDSYDVAPLYPFGFGLSYTSFEITPTFFEANWFNLTLRVKVTNTGKFSGREVVQLYVTSPAGNLQKPYQELKGFAKTGKLKPGESEELTIKFPTEYLASYSDKKHAWIMEHGDYIFRIGENSRDTSCAAKLTLDKLTILKTVADILDPEIELDFIETPERKKESADIDLIAGLSMDDYQSAKKDVKLEKTVVTYIPEGQQYKSTINENKFPIPYRAKEVINYVMPSASSSFIDVATGKVTVEEFVASLPPEILAQLLVGSMEELKKETENRVKEKFSLDKNQVKIAAVTTDQFEKTLGIPQIRMADGPLGLHIAGVACTCFPSPMSMAQTWDVDAVHHIGRVYGQEMASLDIDYCLAPALNIHRDPMAGRSYEFYSEDPVLTGEMAAAFSEGIKRNEGRNVVLKHLAGYNQQRNNELVNCNISKRALREIYLRGFMICIKKASPAAIMNSNNKINGRFTSAMRELNTDILRKDWGFDGFVMTEWGTASEKTYDIHSGCDLIMPAFDPDKILEAMQSTPATFAEDGYVTSVKKCYYYNRAMIEYENWGSFVPDKNGEDVVMTTVAADIEISEKAQTLINEGICTVTVESNGNKTLRYKGTNRGAYLCLGDLQNAAIHILGTILNSASMQKLLDAVK